MWYSVNKPIKRPVWKNHKIVGYIRISRTDADILNSMQKEFYLGNTETEKYLLINGSEEELKETGFINEI